MIAGILSEKTMHKETIASIVSLVLFASAGAALGDTIVVKPDGTGDYPVIQAAIDAAMNGDEILLTDGVFKGKGNKDVKFWGKAVTVRSQSGNPWDCIIDAEGEIGLPYSAFVFEYGEGLDSVVRDLTIYDGSTATVC
jgi:hypothetical protein